MIGRKRSSIVLTAVVTVLALIYLYPIFLVVSNSLKTLGGVLVDPLGLPRPPVLASYVAAWSAMRFPRAFLNTVILAAFTVVGRVLIGSLAGYRLQRTRTRYSRVIFLLCIAPMLVPFHSIMFSWMKVVTVLGLTGKVWGLIIAYMGYCSFDLFLFHNFVSTVPRSLEESAVIDGANSRQVFFRIVFPLLRPVTATIIVLVTNSTWNSLIHPLLTINRSARTRTLTLAMMSFYYMFENQWNLALAGIVMTVIPVLLLYVAFQRNIVSGITAGAIKS